MSRRITEVRHFFASVHREDTGYLTVASFIVVFLQSLDAKLNSSIKVYAAFYYEVTPFLTEKYQFCNVKLVPSEQGRAIT